MQWFWERYAVKALSVQGGEATSRRISVRVGGLVPMADRGEDADEAKTPLVRLESVTSKSVKSSKADEGLDNDSWGFRARYSDGGGCLDSELIIAVATSCRLVYSPLIGPGGRARELRRGIDGCGWRGLI